VLAVFEKMFASFTFDMHGFKTTAFYRDNAIRFMSMIDSIGINSKRADVIFTWVYNLTQNFIIKLLNSRQLVEGKRIRVIIRRFSRDDPLNIGITTTM